MTSPASAWDGVSEFFEEDEPVEHILAVTNRPPDAVTGEEYEPPLSSERPEESLTALLCQLR